jgi:MraZ protein
VGKSGKFLCIFTADKAFLIMNNLIGHYRCKLDAKGRFLIPSALKKALKEQAEKGFVANRGFENCVDLYPLEEWEKKTKEIGKLNTYVKKKRAFIRYFYRGASQLIPDGSSRLLLPQSLIDYAGIDKEIILNALNNKIEIWNAEDFESVIAIEPEEFSAMAEDIFGNKDLNQEE